jgi:CDP-glucose 4,6-dehydratase
LGGRDPYSASKAAAELAYSCYDRSFYQLRKNLGAASARAGNVIGGGDWASDRIIPDCIRAIEANKPVKLRNPFATRPWQHVLEPISGYLLLSLRLYEDPERWRGAWNFGPSTNDVRTVSSVASDIIFHIGRGSLENEEISTNMHEANLLQLNCDKAYNLLNWSSRWNVDATIKHTALWYRAWLNGESMEKITRSQIYEFFPEFL